ncbi:acetyl-CoA carboxylase biotin carboxylase subunit [Micromonospora sp. NPDC047548]|uniref:acetyl-CoA carboxylase biotin carboxylase subunit n=1 Tax=Micromonospora sp. NPDC047548 TaxID=3155624 RepID=UPI0033E5B147
MFAKVLIANRGEIALRIARTCRGLGIRTVAVYSSEDADAAVLGVTDEAVRIGPPPAKRSYLSIPAIIGAARRTGADAIHPGYGFLSEDVDFAEVCTTSGLTFIGPPAPVLRRLGDKALARAAMAEAGLPLLPGTVDPVESLAEAQETAREIGYPVIIKAVGGGGGRGMHVATTADELPGAYQRGRSDAQAFFGNSQVFLERYLPFARHVEVQVLCDGEGRGVHLGERDCSVQRRHQKLIEETPAPHLPAHLLDEMKRLALHGALSVGYVGCCTFEFLVDDRGGFYFLEVNCRIQVEHPVTEMATGVDLVREQIRVAAGYPLGFKQEDIVPRGAAIECRVNAEDPERGFVPTPGLLTEFRPPGGPFVRVDTHGFPGLTISSSYDSLLAKVVVWAPDRDEAIDRMRAALEEFRVAGVSTTSAFLRRVLDEPAFRQGLHSTALVEGMTQPG